MSYLIPKFDSFLNDHNHNYISNVPLHFLKLHYVYNHLFAHNQPISLVNSVCQWPGRPGFDPMLSHIKDSKKKKKKKKKKKST